MDAVRVQGDKKRWRQEDKWIADAYDKQLVCVCQVNQKNELRWNSSVTEESRATDDAANNSHYLREEMPPPPPGVPTTQNARLQS